MLAGWVHVLCSGSSDWVGKFLGLLFGSEYKSHVFVFVFEIRGHCILMLTRLWRADQASVFDKLDYVGMCIIFPLVPQSAQNMNSFFQQKYEKVGKKILFPWVLMWHQPSTKLISKNKKRQNLTTSVYSSYVKIF